MKTVIRLISSGLYVGYSPIFPGTIGSIWGVLIYLQLQNLPRVYIVVTALLFVLGFLLSGRAQELFAEKDSPKIVIDEIASISLVYLVLRPGLIMAGCLFVIFRFFDITKPPPIRRTQQLPGSLGIMLDDLLAAIYTIIVGVFHLLIIRSMGLL